jgi:Tol biopolymer transport system component
LSSDDAWTFRISHDGVRIAQGGFGLWVRDLRRGIAIKLPTPGSETQSWPVWSPDDARIAYVPYARAGGNQRIHVARVDGSGEEAPLPAPPNGSTAIPMDWSPDGRVLLAASEGTASAPQPSLWVYDLQTRTVTHWLTTPGGVAHPRFSPDGRWVAYQSNDTGTPELYLRPFLGPGAAVRVSPAGGGRSAWRADGRELFYLTPAGDLMAVPVAPGGLPDVGPPRRLAPSIRNVPYSFETPYDATPDGKRFLVGVENRTRPPLTLLAPWTLANTGGTR